MGSPEWKEETIHSHVLSNQSPHAQEAEASTTYCKFALQMSPSYDNDQVLAWVCYSYME